MNTLVGPLPRHLYVWAEQSFFRTDRAGLERVVWFGLVSHPGRAWGCNVMTEEGAVYRNLPPQAIAFKEDPAGWTLELAQRWNCYGYGFTTLVYPYLDGLKCWARAGRNSLEGRYLFTAAPVGDAYSEEPEQAKEFTFVALENGRLTVQPTNAVVFEDASFMPADPQWPTNLKRQTRVSRVNE